MFNKLRRYLKSKLYRLGVLKKKTPLFVIKVSNRGFVSVKKSDTEIVIFASNIQPRIYDILLEHWIHKPSRTILVRKRSGLMNQNWYSRRKCINKRKDGISGMVLERIEWLGNRK